MLNLYYNTVKYLRFQQIFYQLFYRFKKASVNFHDVDSVNVSANLKVFWPRAQISTSSLSDNLDFTALNLTANIQDNAIWNSKQFTKLWLYNLHYFDVLSNDNREFIYKKYIDCWLKNNNQMTGPGWEPYPISLRVVNWIKWFSGVGSYEKIWLDSLFLQAELLYKRVEYHILGNHIFANAKALIFLGSFFIGERADAWFDKGLHILKKELKVQFLADGGHFELSPMYHAILLWDICDLLNLAQETKNQTFKNLVPYLQEKLNIGLNWLSLMIHPDREIAFFNDATFGIAPSYKDILEYAQYLQVFDNSKLKVVSDFNIQALPNSGYYIVNLPENSKAILDIAKIGADYQPGHAHADTLSFELSLFQHRFIVNSGISEYCISELRLFQRSTVAHSTVNINSKNSSEIWHGFRVARRANAQLQLLKENEHEILIKGSHDGYRVISRLLTHSRLWKFTKNSLIVIDKVSQEQINNEARFYFHPLVMIKKENDKFNCYLKDRLIRIKFIGANSILLDNGFWYPEFGKKCANKCIVVKFSKMELQTHITWSNY